MSDNLTLTQDNAGIDTQPINIPIDNYRKKLVTTIAYLIGIPDEQFYTNNQFDTEEYQHLKQNEKATIIKFLCRLRTQFLKNYKNIDDARRYDLRTIDSMTEYLDVDGIKFLRSKGIETNISNSKTPTIDIAYLNQYILDNIDSIKPLIPDWIEFKYVKALFLMPGGYAGHGGSGIRNNAKKIGGVIFEAGKTYNSQRNSYPFRMYITWPGSIKDCDGYIFHNDLKFLKNLYSANGDQFKASTYVIDAQSDTKFEIYDFISHAVNVAVFVDCENVDPYAFGATILNLDKGALSKIKKIVLYDDVNTSTAWDYITNIMEIPVIKKDTKRLINSKSLVDITMTVGVCEEYYRNDVESIILVSSDSDFWALINQLPQARFFVMNEKKKTSDAILTQLDQYRIKHCFIGDFAQDSIQKFKSDVLYLGLAEHIKEFNKTGDFKTLDVNELLKTLFNDANINGAESQIQKEKDAFYDRYLRNGLLLKPVAEDGKLRFKIEVYKK